MKNLLNQLNGKKSYLIGLVTVLYGLVVKGLGEQDWDQAQILISGGLGLMAVKHAITKVEK